MQNIKYEKEIEALEKSFNDLLESERNKTEESIRKNMATKDDIKRLEQKLVQHSRLQTQIDNINIRLTKLETLKSTGN
jgi:hypothetical protein